MTIIVSTLGSLAVSGCGDGSGGDTNQGTAGSTNTDPSSGGSGGASTAGTGGLGTGGMGTGGLGTGGMGTGGMGTGGMGTGGLGTGGLGTGGMGTGGLGTGGLGTGGMGTGGMGTGGLGTGGMGTGGLGTGGMGTGGMGTGGMGTGGMDGGVTCTPEGLFDGQPVVAPANTWTWVPVPESTCRGGGSAGFGVRINPASTKLVIYLQQGGACFNVATCSQNASTFSSTKFDTWSTTTGHSGLFDPANPDNSVKDWSFVFVPYCTGDVHAGNATGINVPGGPQGQSFVGYANIGHYLKRIVPTFQGVTEVLLTGDSAGGFGAHYNYDRVAQAFCPTPVALVNDSGPVMTDQYLAPCLQKRWRMLWNLDSTLPAGCDGCSNADGGGLVNAFNAVGMRYPNAHLGVISSDKDSVISMFYGFGKNGCAGIDGPPNPLSGAEYAAGLAEVRAQYMQPWPGWGSYFISSTQHTWIATSSYPTVTVQGVKLVDWVGGVVSGAPTTHIGP